FVAGARADKGYWTTWPNSCARADDWRWLCNPGRSASGDTRGVQFPVCCQSNNKYSVDGRVRYMRWTIRSLGWVMVIGIVLGAAPLAQANGSAEKGAAKAATCQACHGPNGNSVNGQWPSLAGQNAAYIEAQLRQFHNKTRVDPSGLMPPQAAALSEQDIE